MEIEYILISAALTIISIILLSISIHSYKIYRNTRLIFVILVFLVFLTKAILLTLSIFYDTLAPITISYYIAIFDIIILTLLYTSALKR